MSKNKVRQEFVTSDTHFFHKKIIEMGRPQFKDLDEMHKYIISQWNSVVDKDDIVYHLGDFSFGNKTESKAIMDQLNGHKIIVIGNHDGKSNNWFYDVGFAAVVKYMSINKFGQKIDFSHKPKRVKKGVINLHGHLHRGSSQEIMSHSRQHVNVCTELYDYTPITLEDALLQKGHDRPKWFKVTYDKFKYRRKLKKVLANRYPEGDKR